MNILVVMIPVSLVLSLSFLIGFIWSVRSGQVDDTVTPALRILDDGKEQQ